MATGKLFLTGLVALALAIGASSTAAARSSFSFGISTGPAWAGNYSYPACYAPGYNYPPAPVVAHPYPYFHPAPYAVSYPVAAPSFSFGYFGK